MQIKSCIMFIRNIFPSFKAKAKEEHFNFNVAGHVYNQLSGGQPL